MRIKKIVAQDTREAMRLIRDLLGENAVIISSTETADGVEYIVSDEAIEEPITSESSWRASNTLGVSDLQHPFGHPIKDLSREINALRSLVQDQFSCLLWETSKRKNPEQSRLLQQLYEKGFTIEFADVIIRQAEGQIPHHLADLSALMANQFPDPSPSLLQGGTVLICGPAGVGKTTAIAKLASQYSLRYGSESLGLVSLDISRIGGAESLNTYANILNISMTTVETIAELLEACQSFQHKSLVCIDVPPLDASTAEIYTQLRQVGTDRCPLTPVLVVAANTQYGYLCQQFQRYDPDWIQSLILTHVDDSECLGQALSAIWKVKRPIAFYADGAAVPNDFHAAKMTTLCEAALQREQSDRAAISQTIPHQFTKEREYVNTR